LLDSLLEALLRDLIALDLATQTILVAAPMIGDDRPAGIAVGSDGLR